MPETLRRVLLVVFILLIGYATATPALAVAGSSNTSDAELMLIGAAAALAGVLPTTLFALTRWKGTIFPVLMVFLGALVGWLVYVAFLPNICDGRGCLSVFGNEVEDSEVAGLAPAAIAGGATWVILTLAETWRRQVVERND